MFPMSSQNRNLAEHASLLPGTKFQFTNLGSATPTVARKVCHQKRFDPHDPVLVIMMWSTSCRDKSQEKLVSSLLSPDIWRSSGI